MEGIVYLFGSVKSGIQHLVLIKLLFSLCFKSF